MNHYFDPLGTPDESELFGTGITPGRLVGVRATDLLALSARAPVAQAVEAVLTGAEPTSLDSRLLVNGAEERPVRIALAPIVEGYGTGGAMMVLS